MTTHAPLRSRWTKAESVYHVRGLGDGDSLTSPTKDTRLEGVGCRRLFGAVWTTQPWIGEASDTGPGFLSSSHAAHRVSRRAAWGAGVAASGEEPWATLP